MIEDDENTNVENKGNRDNACNTTCRVSGLGFRPGQVYVNQGEEHEVMIVDESGKKDSWFLDDALDSVPIDEDKPNQKLPHTLASQDNVGEKVCMYVRQYIIVLILRYVSFTYDCLC